MTIKCCRECPGHTKTMSRCTRFSRLLLEATELPSLKRALLVVPARANDVRPWRGLPLVPFASSVASLLARVPTCRAQESTDGHSRRVGVSGEGYPYMDDARWGSADPDRPKRKVREFGHHQKAKKIFSPPPLTNGNAAWRAVVINHLVQGKAPTV